MQRNTKALVSVLSGVAMLFLMVQPGSASTGTVNSGHLGVNLIPALTSDLTPGTGPCDHVWPPPGTHRPLAMDATSSGAVAVHATLHVTYHSFIYGSTVYFLSGITAHGTGTMNSTTQFTIGPFTSTIGNIYPETFSGSCIPDTTRPLCAGVRLNTTTAPLNIHGSFPAGHTISGPALTGTAVFSGSGGVQAATCLPPFSALNGKTITLNVNLTLV